MPPHLIKRKKAHEDALSPRWTRVETLDANHVGVLGETYKVNNVRDSRILALQQEHKLVNFENSSLARDRCK